MSHVAARPASPPADSAVVHARHPAGKGRPDDKADADFGKHIDGLAVDRGPARTPVLAARADRERPAARWGLLEADPPLLDEEPAAAVEMLAPADVRVAQTPSDADTPVPLPPPAPVPLESDLAAAAASVVAGSAGLAPAGQEDATGPARRQQPTPVGGDDVPRASPARSPTAAALPAAPAELAQVPIAPERPHPPRCELPTQAREGPRPAVETPRAVPEVRVIARETHLPPAAPPPAVRARPPAEREVAQPRTVSAAPEPEAGADAPVVVDSGANGDAGGDTEDPRRSPASPAAGRLPPPDVAPRARVETRGEPPLDPAQPARAVRPPVQDDHPMPQATVPVSRQILDGIAAELPPRLGASAAGPAAPAPSPMPQPVKVVTIQLSPAELGTLTVRIALRNDTLELQVETSRRDTARLLDADRETLSSLLRSAGYHVEAVTVRAVEQPAAAIAAGSTPGSPDGAPQPQSGGSQADQRPAGGRAHAGGHREGHGTRQDNTGDEGSLRRGAGRGLYV